MSEKFDPKQYWDNRLNKHYNLIGVGDISLSINYNKWSYKITQKILRRLFLKYSSSSINDKVLDIGCGTGFVVEIWKSLDKSVTGIDISSTAVNNLRSKYPKFSFHELDIGSSHVNLPKNSFSFCSAASVLYHLVDDIALDTALDNIHRLLKPNGIFIFSENFIHEGTFSISHQKCRTLQEYEKILKSKNFEIIEKVPNYVLMNEPVDSRRWFYPKLWRWLTRLSKKSKWFDKVIWPSLYPIELLLTAIKKESPAQEFMICKAVK